jgi:hypothetical protein
LFSTIVIRLSEIRGGQRKETVKAVSIHSFVRRSSFFEGFAHQADLGLAVAFEYCRVALAKL